MTNIVVVCQEEHDKGYEEYSGVCLLCEIKRAVLAEREACALIGDYYHDEEANCGDLIRARGQD